MERGVWQELAELGWLGVSVAEEAGGAGLGFVEEAVLFEELGRALYPGPYFSTVRSRCRRCRRRSGAGRGGERALVGAPSARSSPTATRSTRVVGADGAAVEPLESIDATRPLGRLAAAVPSNTALRATRSALRAAAALALEAVGIAQKALELGVEHASTREQFGKPIGVYQAVSHQLADTYVETELARSLAYWAAWCVAEGDEQAPVAVAAAKALLRRDRGRRLRARRSRSTAASASPGSTSCTATTSARSGSSRSAAHAAVQRAQVAAALLD